MSDEKREALTKTELRKTRRTYDGQFKARVVCEWISGGKDLEELSHCYSVHPNQIKNWKRVLFKNASLVLSDKRKGKKSSKSKPIVQKLSA
jgi:transposase